MTEKRDIRELVEASSLGTLKAKAMRASVPDDAVRRVVERADVLRAIARVEDSRESHRLWIDYFEKWPETEAQYVETVGDIEHNRRIIAEYDHVLGVLRRLL